MALVVQRLAVTGFGTSLSNTGHFESKVQPTRPRQSHTFKLPPPPAAALHAARNSKPAKKAATKKSRPSKRGTVEGAPQISTSQLYDLLRPSSRPDQTAEQTHTTPHQHTATSSITRHYEASSKQHIPQQSANNIFSQQTTVEVDAAEDRFSKQRSWKEQLDQQVREKQAITQAEQHQSRHASHMSLSSSSSSLPSMTRPSTASHTLPNKIFYTEEKSNVTDLSATASLVSAVPNLSASASDFSFSATRTANRSHVLSSSIFGGGGIDETTRRQSAKEYQALQLRQQIEERRQRAEAEKKQRELEERKENERIERDRIDLELRYRMQNANILNTTTSHKQKTSSADVPTSASIQTVNNAPMRLPIKTSIESPANSAPVSAREKSNIDSARSVASSSSSVIEYQSPRRPSHRSRRSRDHDDGGVHNDSRQHRSHRNTSRQDEEYRQPQRRERRREYSDDDDIPEDNNNEYRHHNRQQTSNSLSKKSSQKHSRSASRRSDDEMDEVEERRTSSRTRQQQQSNSQQSEQSRSHGRRQSTSKPLPQSSSQPISRIHSRVSSRDLEERQTTSHSRKVSERFPQSRSRPASPKRSPPALPPPPPPPTAKTPKRRPAAAFGSTIKTVKRTAKPLSSQPTPDAIPDRFSALSLPAATYKAFIRHQNQNATLSTQNGLLSSSITLQEQFELTIRERMQQNNQKNGDEPSSISAAVSERQKPLMSSRNSSRNSGRQHYHQPEYDDNHHHQHQSRHHNHFNNNDVSNHRNLSGDRDVNLLRSESEFVSVNDD